MNIKNYYSKAAMLFVSLGFITALQSCSKDSGIIPGSSEDKNLIGAWKRTIRHTAKGDTVQTIAFYEGFLASLQEDVSATPIPGSTVTTSLYKGLFDTNGSQLYFKLNQKQNSTTDLNGTGTPVNRVLYDTTPYKISGDTLKITVGSTLVKYLKVG